MLQLSFGRPKPELPPPSWTCDKYASLRGGRKQKPAKFGKKAPQMPLLGGMAKAWGIRDFNEIVSEMRRESGAFVRYACPKHAPFVPFFVGPPEYAGFQAAVVSRLEPIGSGQVPCERGFLIRSACWRYLKNRKQRRFCAPIIRHLKTNLIRIKVLPGKSVGFFRIRIRLRGNSHGVLHKRFPASVSGGIKDVEDGAAGED